MIVHIATELILTRMALLYTLVQEPPSVCFVPLVHDHGDIQGLSLHWRCVALSWIATSLVRDLQM